MTDAEEVVGVVEVVDVERQMRLVIVGVRGRVALVVGRRARLGRALDSVESLGGVERAVLGLDPAVYESALRIQDRLSTAAPSRSHQRNTGHDHPCVRTTNGTGRYADAPSC